MQEINTEINSRRSVCILVNILLQSEGQETTRKLYQNNSSVKYHGNFITFICILVYLLPVWISSRTCG